MYPDRTMVEDPLVLLELGEMRCGHVARLAVDLFAAAGYRGRLVFLYQHEIAEIRYGMRWHYLDADVFGGGQVALDPDGSIPSVAELSKRPYRIDAPDGPYQEPNFRNQIDLGSIIYPSYYYFSNNNPRFAYVYKTSSYVAENSSRYYGWENIQIVTASDIRMSYRRPYYLPGAPNLQGVTMTPTPQGQLQVSVSWSASIDKDHDLLGYRVFVSRQSRGWNYGNTDQPLKSSTQPWRPDMYDARFSLPPSDVALLTVGTTTVTFVLDNAADYFVSVMPFDAHGEVAGRTLYPVSEEIRIPNWTVTNNVRAPCKGVVLQWVQLPPGNCCSSQ